MRRFSIFSATVIALLISANAWGVAPSYVLTDLGPGSATAINASDQVAGYTGSGLAFLYTQGTMTTLGTLGGSYSQAYALNDNGQVAGLADVTDGNYHAFLYNGTMNDLGTLGGDTSIAYGINIGGQVVGSSNNQAFLYNGTMQGLGTLGGIDSEARDINASGVIVGWSWTSSGGPEHAFIYSGGSMHDLGTLPGGNYACALRINAGGEVTGNAVNNLGNYRAFLYNGTSMQDLGTLSGFDNSWGIGINDAGEVVGAVTTSSGSVYHAMLDVGGTMYDLNTLVGNLGGLTLSEAEGVNDSGSIVGFGTIGGVQHGFLLTPTPEPSTLVLSLLGAIGLGLYGWQRCVRRS
jgi:probable HAF family extracellular repeat protein